MTNFIKAGTVDIESLQQQLADSELARKTVHEEWQEAEEDLRVAEKTITAIARIVWRTNLYTDTDRERVKALTDIFQIINAEEPYLMRAVMDEGGADGTTQG